MLFLELKQLGEEYGVAGVMQTEPSLRPAALSGKHRFLSLPFKSLFSEDLSLGWGIWTLFLLHCG